MPQCEGVTKWEVQCANNAQTDSKFCGIHRPDKPKRKRRKTTQKRGLQCTYCGSTSVRAFSQIYLGGQRGGRSGAYVTSRGSVGVGASGAYLTPAAQSASPPAESHSFGYNTVSTIGILFALGSCSIAGAGDSWGVGILLFIAITAGTMFLAESLSSEKAEQEWLEGKMDDWENSYRCSKCGNEFIWRKY